MLDLRGVHLYTFTSWTIFFSCIAWLVLNLQSFCHLLWTTLLSSLISLETPKHRCSLLWSNGNGTASASTKKKKVSTKWFAKNKSLFVFYPQGNNLTISQKINVQHMGVSKNSGTPKSSMLIGFGTIIFTIHFGGYITLLFLEIAICSILLWLILWSYDNVWIHGAQLSGVEVPFWAFWFSGYWILGCPGQEVRKSLGSVVYNPNTHH